MMRECIRVAGDWASDPASSPSAASTTSSGARSATGRASAADDDDDDGMSDDELAMVTKRARVEDDHAVTEGEGEAAARKSPAKHHDVGNARGAASVTITTGMRASSLKEQHSGPNA